MNQVFIYALVSNTTLLIALSLIQDVPILLPKFLKHYRLVLQGIVTAIICLIVMTIPFTLKPGLTFDTRSILISVTAFTTGFVPVAITVVAATIYRLLMGGVGVIPGIAVIISSAMIGLAWRKWLYPKSENSSKRWFCILGMGMTVHLVMILCMLLLPYPTSIEVIKILALPVLSIYPLGSLFLTAILFRQERNRQVQEQLSLSEKRYSSYIKYAPSAIFVVDEQGKYLETNQAAVQITGYTQEELVGKSILDLIPKESHEKALHHFERLVRYGTMKQEFPFLRKDGSKGWWSVDAVKVEENRYLGFSLDLTEQKKAQDEILYQNNHDFLTDLHNRQFFEKEKKRLDQIENLPLSVVMVDINGVRFINDAFGYQVGDELLRATAGILKSCCRPGDVLARVGGDEFYMLLPYTSIQEVNDFVKEIENHCKQFNQSQRTKLFEISLTIGYDTKEEMKDPISEVLKTAEGHLLDQKLLNRKSFHSDLISSMMATVYEKSQETEEHTKRLANMAIAIGAKMKLPQKSLSRLELGATLHDIGKIAIDDQILKKPGKLTEEEWKIMRQHPEIGYRIAISTMELEPIADLIRYHQERWDGKGYPDGLKGEEIPLLARIISIVDAYDAMTNDRVYREAKTRAEAIEEINSNAGTQFDPAIVALFNEVV